MFLETIFPLRETETLIPDSGSLNHAVFLSILLTVLCLSERGSFGARLLRKSRSGFLKILLTKRE